MKVRYTATAREEAEAIIAHVAAANSAAAATVASAIQVALANLRSFPHIGSKTNTPGIYLRIARPYHYLIFYSIVGDTVVVQHVRHPSRHRPGKQA